MYTEDNLYKLIRKKLAEHKTSVNFINVLHNEGMPRVNLMIMEMILIDTPLDKVSKVLLITPDSFEDKLREIVDFLSNLKSKPSFVSKRKIVPQPERPLSKWFKWLTPNREPKAN